MKFLGERLAGFGLAMMSMSFGYIGVGILWAVKGVPADPAFTIAATGGFLLALSLVSTALSAAILWRVSK